MDVPPLKKQRLTTDDVRENEEKPLVVNDVENEKTTFDFKEKTWKEDFVLVVENKKLHVTKSVLAHASPVFDKMFQAEFKEKNLTELELPGKKEEDVRTFLLCIYPNSVEVSPENVYSVLPLVEEYQVSYLKSKCETCLLAETNDSLSSDDLYKMLHLATLYNLSALLQKCISLASEKPASALHDAEKHMTIPLATKCMILEKLVMRHQHQGFLEILNRYHASGLKREAILEIKDYANWDGKTLHFSVTLNKCYLFKVHLLHTSVECKLEIMGTSFKNTPSNLGLKLKIDQFGDKRSLIRIVGRIVIKPIKTKNENITRTFDVHQRTTEEVTWSDLRNVWQGYIFNSKLNVEVHMLAERK